MNTIVHVVATRPNFVKMAPVIDALSGHASLRQVIVHTGQHYDRRLSDDVRRDVEFPDPDHFLGIGGGTHAEQTGWTMIAFERLLTEEQPSLVVVAGDVNATLACALAAAKLHVPIAHVEAGLRSGDWMMPEEINRVLTDRVSNLLFTHSPEARTNLVSEGIDPSRIHYVGNTMIDTLLRAEPSARSLRAWRRYGAEAGDYVLVTLHRPSNVDDGDRLRRIARELVHLAQRCRIIFPCHPRTTTALSRFGGLDQLTRAGVNCVNAIGYLEFLSLEVGAGAVLTDSGGVQEEASALGVPCYTLRTTTERPITLTHGTNRLLGEDPESIQEVRPRRRNRSYRPEIPMWDGEAGRRVAEVITTAPVVHAVDQELAV
jgi:UDP-N-acetylglucosamine 2-epimerase (non-hydrolysing)